MVCVYFVQVQYRSWKITVGRSDLRPSLCSFSACSLLLSAIHRPPPTASQTQPVSSLSITITLFCSPSELYPVSQAAKWWICFHQTLWPCLWPSTRCPGQTVTDIKPPNPHLYSSSLLGLYMTFKLSITPRIFTLLIQQIQYESDKGEAGNEKVSQIRFRTSHWLLSAVCGNDKLRLYASANIKLSKAIWH